MSECDVGQPAPAQDGAADAEGLKFELLAFRFRFSARESVYFPPGKSGNVVRGAFGTIF